MSIFNKSFIPREIKVTIRGTDGKLYAFLSKAKDDLRIDYRIMEFFSADRCLAEGELRARAPFVGDVIDD